MREHNTQSHGWRTCGSGTVTLLLNGHSLYFHRQPHVWSCGCWLNLNLTRVPWSKTTKPLIAHTVWVTQDDNIYFMTYMPQCAENRNKQDIHDQNIIFKHTERYESGTVLLIKLCKKENKSVSQNVVLKSFLISIASYFCDTDICLLTCLFVEKSSVRFSHGTMTW